MTTNFSLCLFGLVLLQLLISDAYLCTTTSKKSLYMSNRKTTGANKVPLLQPFGESKGVVPPIMHAAIIATLLLFTPTINVAATNPDAIDVRRVDQEPAMAPQAPRKKVETLSSGVQYFDAVEGTGKEAARGNSVQFEWVLRRSNGYFVDSSDNYGEPFIYKVGNTEKVISGLDEAIQGMKAGGVRKINTPAKVAFREVGDGKPGPMPSGFGPRRQILTRIDNETWYWEIKLKKVK
jgi:hypothetical protein